MSTSNGGGLLFDSGVGPSNTSSGVLSNVGLTASVGSSALTINLTDSLGNAPTASSSPSVSIGFKNPTANIGLPITVQVASATSLVIPSGTTIGTTNGSVLPIYVYAIDNAGAVTLGASLSVLDEGTLQSTSAISGGTNPQALYSATSLVSVPVRLIGRIIAGQSVAGTWNSSPTQIATYPFLDAQVNTVSTLLSNLGLSSSVATNALTVSITDAFGNVPSNAAAPNIAVGFRNSTATVGLPNRVTITSATSIVIPSGTTIGTQNGEANPIYVYAINNSGTVAIGLSLALFDEGTLQTTTAISGGSSATTLYSTSIISSMPVRLIGRIKASQATAGTWSSAATEIATIPFPMPTKTTTVQIFTSGTAQIYTTPTSPIPKQIRVRACGGGGGGSANSNSAVGSTGGATTFGTSLLTANGGGGGSGSNNGGAGGSSSITTSASVVQIVAVSGGSGGGGGTTAATGPVTNFAGGCGGNNPFGGGGGGGVANSIGLVGAAGTGGGGGGGGSDGNSTFGGCGGGSGGYLEAYIYNPLATYTYTVGGGGAAGNTGVTGSGNGAAGGSGIIIVEEIY